MRTAIWPLQTALYQRLTTDAALMAVVTGGVFDGELPTGSGRIDAEDDISLADDQLLINDEIRLPYMVIGEETVGDYSTKTFNGEELTKTIHVWSDYRGRKEAANIMDLALQAITASPLNMAAGFTFDFCQRELLEVFKEDGGLFHGVMRLRFRIKQI